MVEQLWFRVYPRQEELLLDIACGLGQDLRRLRADSAKGHRYSRFAVDTKNKMWRIGMDL